MKVICYISILFFVVTITLLIFVSPCIYVGPGPNGITFRVFSNLPIKIFSFIVSRRIVFYLIVLSFSISMILSVIGLCLLFRVDKTTLKWPYYLSSSLIILLLLVSVLFVSQQHKFIGYISKTPSTTGLHIIEINSEENVVYMDDQFGNVIKVHTNKQGIRELSDITNNPPKGFETFLIYKQNNLLGDEFFWLDAIYIGSKVKYQFIYSYGERNSDNLIIN